MTESITQSLTATSYDQRQLALIKNTIGKGLSNDEFSLLVEVAKRTGLDLFTHQMYGIKRGDQMTIQTGIDGYRLMAARTGSLAGIDDALFDSEDGDHPNKASVTVWRFVHRQRVPFTATARWSEYASDKSPMWKKMPFLMLAKCAEALALRKAFPAELSGIYTKEEMDQADAEPILPTVVTPTNTAQERLQHRIEEIESAGPRPVPLKQGYGTLHALPETSVEEEEPAVEHVPYEPTERDWKALKARVFKAKLATSPEQWEQLMEETGGSYEDAVAKVQQVEHDLHELGASGKGRH